MTGRGRPGAAEPHPPAVPAWPPSRGDPWIVLGVALAHCATFLAKPVHMDDALYLSTVRGILADPLHPLCNVYNWEAGPRPIYTFAINPPLYNYQQALLVRLFGWNLTALHLLAAGYVLLATLAMLALARRFTRWPVPALLLLMFAPTVLPQTNLMLDMPGMALVLAALAAWVHGVDRGSNRWLALGSVAAALALLTKYNSGITLFLMILYAVLHERRRAIVWLVVPLLGLGLWMLHNHFFMPGGTLHLLQAGQRIQAEPGRGYLQPLIALVSWGSAFIFFPVLALRSWIAGRRRLGAAFAVPAALILALDLSVSSRSSPPWFMAPYAEHLIFLVNGLLIAAYIGVSTASAWRKQGWRVPAGRDDVFLLAWPIAMTIFICLLAPHQAPRYYFPAYAAVPFLLLRALERSRGGFTAAARRAVWASIVAQAALALILTASDDAFARASREYAERLATLAETRGEMITFEGHWGFQYYAEQHPLLRALDPRLSPPPPGVVVAVLLDSYAWEFPPWLAGLSETGEPGILKSSFADADGRPRSLRFRLIEPPWSAPHPWPLRTIDLADGVMLYASGDRVPYGHGTGAFHSLIVLQCVP